MHIMYFLVKHVARGGNHEISSPCRLWMHKPSAVGCHLFQILLYFLQGCVCCKLYGYNLYFSHILCAIKAPTFCARIHLAK